MQQEQRIPDLIRVFYGLIVVLNVVCAKRETLHDISKRSVNVTMGYLPPDFPVGNLKNATPIVCSDVITIPSISLVQRTAAQMKAMLEDMGGSYVTDYMAATAEEARRNFPNLLKLSEMYQNSSSTDTPVSVYDNFIAKQVIADDLQKLMFYFLNKTMPNGQPAMAIKTVTSLNELMTSVKPNRPLTPSTYPTPLPVFTKKSTKKYITPPLAAPVLYKTTNIQTTSGNIHINNTATATVNNNKHTTRTTLSTLASDSSTHGGVVSITPYQTTTSKPTSTSKTSVTMSSTSTTTPKAATTVTEGPTSIATTTIDPVSKSLDELQRYMNHELLGDLYNNLSSNDLNRVWREANTTLHPGALLGLKPSETRVKRATAQFTYDDNLKGSFTQENYCQSRGSLTSDHKYLHLCSSCAATTRLSEDYFPRYINEAVCKQGDNSCFILSGHAQGACKQSMFTLKIMRRRRGHCSIVLHNGQTMAVDDWQLVHKTIRVSCECTLNKLSMFKPYV